MRTSFFLAAFLVVFAGHATNMTNFSCNSGISTLVMQLPELNQSSDDETSMTIFRYYDGRHLFVANNVSIEDRLVTAGLSMPWSETGARIEQAVATIKLPKKLTVELVQEGGYYFPITRTVPVSFNAKLEIVINGEITLSRDLSCGGINRKDW